MADDKSKKPKINLKDRLGKTNIGTQSVPLPVPGASQQAGGAPQGIAPPPGITPGIPVPPFGGAKPAVSEPPPPKPPPKPQEIKVDTTELIKVEEKAKKRLIGAAIGTALFGIAIGYVVGGQAAKADRGKAVIANAKALMGDIKSANEKMKELDTLLAESVEKLQKKEYPAELSAQLGAINIPFDATKVDGGGISGLKPSALRQLLKFTSSCEELNDKKDKLKSLLDFAKDPVLKAWKEEKEPVMNFSVLFRSDQKGVIAEFVPNKEPFDIGKDWPANYTITKIERGKPAEKKLTRYTGKGDLPGTDIVIPIDPGSTAIFTSQEGIRNLRKAFLDLREELKGGGTDQDPVPGSIELGDALLTELQKVTQGG